MTILRHGLMIAVLTGCSPSVPLQKVRSYLEEEKKRVPAKEVVISFPSGPEKSWKDLMPASLKTLLIQWKKEHFVTDALEGALTIVVEKADIDEVKLSKDPGFFGLFPKERCLEKYVGSITIMVHYTYPGMPKMSGSKISVSTEKAIPRDATMQDRRLLLSYLCENLLMLLTQETDKLLNSLFCHIRTKP